MGSMYVGLRDREEYIGAKRGNQGRYMQLGYVGGVGTPEYVVDGMYGAKGDKGRGRRQEQMWRVLGSQVTRQQDRDSSRQVCRIDRQVVYRDTRIQVDGCGTGESIGIYESQEDGMYWVGDSMGIWGGRRVLGYEEEEYDWKEQREEWIETGRMNQWGEGGHCGWGACANEKKGRRRRSKEIIIQNIDYNY